MLPSLAKLNIQKTAVLMFLLYKQGKIQRDKKNDSISDTRTAATETNIEKYLNDHLVVDFPSKHYGNTCFSFVKAESKQLLYVHF